MVRSHFGLFFCWIASSCASVSSLVMASSSDSPSVSQLIRNWSAPSRVASGEEGRVCDKLTEVLKQHLKLETRQLVTDARGRPILCSYSNDGTPLRAVTRKTTTGSMGKVTREGGAGHELLVQRAVYRTRDSTGGWKTLMDMRDPLPLVHGKGADAIFSAAAEFQKTLRQMGHAGIAVQHYGFDRALHTPLVRRFKQHHALLASAGEGTVTAGESPLPFDPPMLEWILDTGCVNHDCHNALKWGMMEWIADESLMSTVYIVIESIRNGFSLVEAELGLWLARVVMWVDDEDLIDPLEAAALWASLGVEPRWVDHLVDMGVLWISGRLLVRIRHRERPGVWEDLLNCIRYSLHFKAFSDSRWCTVGRSCRQVLFAQLLGLNSLVHSVLEDPTTSNYLIGGFKQLSVEVQKFIVVASFASWTSEALLAELLEDDRLCLHYSAYKQNLQQEMESLMDVPEMVWEIVSELVDSEEVHGVSLRSLCLGCAHTSLGFIGSRVWSVCESWPWTDSRAPLLQPVFSVE